MEKTDADRDISYPRKLIEFADSQKDNPELDFDPEHDRMVIVFDADIFERKVRDYDEVIRLGEEHNILGITNPAFELFLLLHIEDSWDKWIRPDVDRFFAPENIGGKAFERGHS